MAQIVLEEKETKELAEILYLLIQKYSKYIELSTTIGKELKDTKENIDKVVTVLKDRGEIQT